MIWQVNMQSLFKAVRWPIRNIVVGPFALHIQPATSSEVKKISVSPDPKKTNSFTFKCAKFGSFRLFSTPFPSAHRTQRALQRTRSRSGGRWRSVYRGHLTAWGRSQMSRKASWPSWRPWTPSAATSISLRRGRRRRSLRNMLWIWRTPKLFWSSSSPSRLRSFRPRLKMPSG